MTLAPLNRTILGLLVEFHEAGGSGQLDIHNRLQVGPTRTFLPSDSIHNWLRLVARGYVCGEKDFLIVTEEGRVEAERIIAARIKGVA